MHPRKHSFGTTCTPLLLDLPQVQVPSFRWATSMAKSLVSYGRQFSSITEQVGPCFFFLGRFSPCFKNPSFFFGMITTPWPMVEFVLPVFSLFVTEVFTHSQTCQVEAMRQRKHWSFPEGEHALLAGLWDRSAVGFFFLGGGICRSVDMWRVL